MPYIPKPDRVAIDGGLPPTNAGELNYLLTKLCRVFLGPAPNYARFNDVLGALEGCKLELYRRLVATYEDAKREQNGDVF